MQERTILSGIDLKAYVGNLYKNPRFTEEMARLVTSDLESGLSKEETEEYSGGRYDYSQMCVYSKCIHKHYSPEEKKVILRDGLSGEQMALALEFYERGVPLATVAEITGNIGQTAYAMERRFQQVLEKAREAQETAETEQISRQDKAYMEGLVKQIQEAVAKISFQEEKYAALDKRFQELQTEKQDKEIRERLLAQLSEKDRTIEDQQNQINHAKTEVAKLKKELEDSFLKAFTEEQIRVIMDSEFEERIAGLNQAAGKKQVKTGSSIQEITPLDALRCSVKYVVFHRCGFELTEEMQDFSFITAFQEEQEIYHLGSLTSDISCEVLRGISNDLLKIEERGIVYGENYNNIPQRGRRDVVSGSGITEGSRVNDGAWQVRSQGSTVPERELPQQVSGTGEVWETGRENAGSGRRSKPEDGNPGKQLSGKKQAGESRVHNRTVAVEAAGKDAGRGNRYGGNHTEIPLGQELFSKEDTENKRKAELELEIQQELKEIDAAGNFSMQEGSPAQASFSFGADGQLSLPGQYPYKKTEQKLAVPQEYIRQVLLLGSGFSDGKKRIYNLFQQVSDTEERIRALKEEYGAGGSNWPLDGTGLHGYDTFYGKGIHFLWREEDGEKEGYVSWKGIERELSDLIMAGEYYQPPKQFSKEEGKEETLWLLPLKDYFNHEIQYIAVKVLIYDIFTTNLDMEVKQEFLARIYGEKRDGFFMAEYADNSYGKCHITRDQEGITITYPEADGTKAEKRVDYSYCAYLVLHMIEENEYLSEGIFERFQEVPEAFTAMPWFMEIYHDYKERMKKELFFEAIQIESAGYVQSDRSGQNRICINLTEARL